MYSSVPTTIAKCFEGAKVTSLFYSIFSVGCSKVCSQNNNQYMHVTAIAVTQFPTNNEIYI